MTDRLSVRPVQISDAERLAEIYLYYVNDTAVSFEYKAPSAEEFIKRIENALRYLQGIPDLHIFKPSHCYFLKVTLSRCHISSTYSWMVRSEVNLPEHATLRMAILAHLFSSLYASSTRF